jgi:kanamycin kinase
MTTPPSHAPARVSELAAGERLRLVWENECGGLTFDVGEGPDRRFVKWAPAGSQPDLMAEVPRMRWAIGFTTVPRVLGHGTDDTGSWLVTAPLAGESAVSERWLAQPGRALSAIGAGLRAFHDALPVDGCPFSWSAQQRLAHVAAANRDRVAEPPPIDRAVVCHGDACAPNTIVADDGSVAGHVDLGSLGVADRWADIAIATYATEWNYGPGWEEHLLDAYGVGPDPVRTAYYRLLWDLTED